MVDIFSTQRFTPWLFISIEIMINMKNIFIVRPYAVGSKSAKAKSLAFVIPAPVREKAKIIASSILMLQINEMSSEITLQNMDEIIEVYKNNPATKNIKAQQEPRAR